MIEIRTAIAGDIFDYCTLKAALGDYRSVRDKITALLRKGVVVRIKKGLYVFGPDWARTPISKEVLANLIYGPSYISLDYALSYYGLIPERVETVTSICLGRCKLFDSPVGRFSYRSLNLRSYPIGIKRDSSTANNSFLIATKEKALADKIFFDCPPAAGAKAEAMTRYLEHNLRLASEETAKLNLQKLATLAKVYRSKKVTMLYETLRRMRGI